jgi:hypothetical protein
MNDILMSSPLLVLYVLYVVALLVAAFWPEPSSASSVNENSKPGRPELGASKPRGWGQGE